MVCELCAAIKQRDARSLAGEVALGTEGGTRSRRKTHRTGPLGGWREQQGCRVTAGVLARGSGRKRQHHQTSQSGQRRELGKVPPERLAEGPEGPSRQWK